ncbi:MAG: S1/P1 nuclease [Elusimicrobiota bacterium]
MKTPRCLPRILSLAAAAALIPRPASAWSANGHSTIAQIAQDLLTKNAQGGDAASGAALASIKAIMTSDPADTGFAWSDNALSQLAPCADSIRVEPASPGYPAVNAGDPVTCDKGLIHFTAAATSALHFVDVSVAAPATPDSVAAACASAGGACVVGAIENNLAVLSDPAASMADKKLALAYVVHFVGDEHQPLHCATQYVDPSRTGPNDRSDHGGNGKGVKLGGAVLNLHSLWDHQIAATDAGNDPAVESKRLEDALPAGATSDWTAPGFVAAAALESFDIAQNAIYKPFPSYPTTTAMDEEKKRPTTVSILPGDYESQMRPIVDGRLQRGGVRLAALLKQALGGSSNAPAAAPVPPAVQKAEDGVRRAESTPL